MNMYAKQHTTKREQKKRSAHIVLSASFRISLLASFAVFVVLYVIQTTAVSTKGFVVSDLEKKIGQLKDDTRRLDAEVAEQQSMHNLQDRLKTTRLVAVDRVDYVAAGATVVAKR